MTASPQLQANADPATVVNVATRVNNDLRDIFIILDGKIRASIFLPSAIILRCYYVGCLSLLYFYQQPLILTFNAFATFNA